MNSWSFSRYDTWSKCPYRAKLQYVDRCPVPPNPKADRGTMLHENAQAFVGGTSDELHQDLAWLQERMTHLRQLNLGSTPVRMEEEWAWTQNFNEFCAWDSPTAWVRMKLDFEYRLEPTVVKVIDLKSGKKSGNEIKHTEQAQLYAVGVMARYPDVERVDTEFLYSDQQEATPTSFTAAQVARLIPTWIKRGQSVTNGAYPPRPNIFTCKWCPFRQVEDGGSGACAHAVKIVKATRKASPGGFFSFKE